MRALQDDDEVQAQFSLYTVTGNDSVYTGTPTSHSWQSWTCSTPGPQYGDPEEQEVAQHGQKSITTANMSMRRTSYGCSPIREGLYVPAGPCNYTIFPIKFAAS